MNTRFRVVFLLLAAVFVLCACGQTGPLTLPQPEIPSEERTSELSEQ